MIVDLPHAWTPWIKACLIAADEIVIVATPDLASLRNAKNIIELVRHARPNDTPPRLVINQANMPKRPEIPAKDFAETMGVEPIADAGIRPRPVRPGRQQRPDAAGAGPQGADFGRRAPAGPHPHRPRSRGAPAKKSPTSIFSFLKSRKAGLNHVRQAQRQ